MSDQAIRSSYIELFAGAGGLSHGLDRAGWECLGHAEIEPHARAVLRYRWPDVPLHGDVSTLDGRQWRGVTLISGGSPCQDLSIAGKRAGLSGRRSGLFFHQVRLWRESEAPFCLWENVVGALSSREGKDFARVLSSFLGEPVAVPRDNKRRRAQWPKAGVLSGTTGACVAWRVVDLRGFDVPQRRRRVFVLAARTGGVDCGEILLDLDRVCGDSAASGEAGKADSGADSVRAGGGGGREVGVDAIAFQPGNLVRGAGAGPSRTTFPTLCAREGRGAPDQAPPVIASHAEQNPISGSDVPALAVAFKVRGGVATDAAGKSAGKGFLGADDEAFTIGTSQDQYIASGNGVLTAAERGNGDGATVNTLTGDHANRVTDYTPLVQQVLFTRQRTDQYDAGQNEASTITMRDYKSPTDLVVAAPIAVNISDGVARLEESVGSLMARSGSGGVGADAQMQAVLTGGPLPFHPRRLTPVECERLMSWPDGWTATGINEQGQEYQLADTPRYKLCGNGVASVVACWIGARLRDALEVSA